MATKILLDTSVLIDYFRKTDKQNSFFYSLILEYDVFLVPVISQFEILIGINESQKAFWEELFTTVEVIPFTEFEAVKASEIYRLLKRSNDLIGNMDLLIAATAIQHDLPIATTNAKHFSRVPNLKLVLPQ